MCIIFQLETKSDLTASVVTLLWDPDHSDIECNAVELVRSWSEMKFIRSELVVGVPPHKARLVV